MMKQEIWQGKLKLKNLRIPKPYKDINEWYVEDFEEVKKT